MVCCRPGEPVTGARLYVFAVIGHATRRIRVLGATAHPTTDWIVQLGRDLVMDLRTQATSRDSKFTAAFDTVLADAGLKVVTTGIRIPRMNSLMERWIQTCRREHLHPHLDLEPEPLAPRAPRVRDLLKPASPAPSSGPSRSAPATPRPIDEPAQIRRLEVRRRDRLGGTPQRVPTCRIPGRMIYRHPHCPGGPGR
ncbi:transposase [Streptomyces griseoflavus Tu4000]|uniref:Transposase n=1 Tax=Streptomyces griseoflavus Tu4000 TaxID=467200 RepID=D9XJ72_9ACTN|nr:transposase [Streptomyces griseoflavus Tu4000]